MSEQEILFKDLGFSPELLKAIEECGYTSPTPIQAKSIPQILMARDLVGLAQTGTGKTASFTLPMIEILAGGRAKARMPRSLILSPTRELAAQIAENFEKYGKYSKLSMALLTGGSNMNEQIKLLERGVDVLIATPGRLLDLFDRGQILMNDIKIFVIDEADRMMDMGFIPDIEKVASLLSPMRQTLLFSATMPDEIKKLTEKFLSNPKEVSVAAVSSTADTVEQFVVKTDKRSKKKVLEQIIKSEDVRNAFVFCNRKRDIDDVVKHLQKAGFTAGAMHGDMVQKARTEKLDAFKNGEIALLVCSDVAGRGIDVDNISHVFNYDVPFNPDDYVHRIGRTGRAGKTGRAWMLMVPDAEDKQLENVESLIKTKIEVVELDKPKGKSKPDAKAKRDNVKDFKKSKHVKPKQEESEPKRNQRGNRGNKGRGNEEQSTTKGFGDDMPAFFSGG